MKNLYAWLAKLNNENSPVFDFIVFLSEIYFRIFFRGFYKKDLINFRREFESRGKTYEIRKIDERLAPQVYNLISNLKSEHLPPHRTDLSSVKRILRKRCFFATGIFDGEKLAGYGLIRHFPIKGVTAAIFIDHDYQRKGLYGLWSGTMFVVYKVDFKGYGFNIYTTVEKQHEIAIHNNLKTGLKVFCDAGDFLVFKA